MAQLEPEKQHRTAYAISSLHAGARQATGFGEMYDAYDVLSGLLLTNHNCRYYEGKEFETQLKHKRPGDLSPELVEALSIPPLAPPPWLISMQRFGPPPSYPTLRIPGLNAPIPEGYVRCVNKCD